MMEKLTSDMADKAWGIIQEIEAMGGMTKAVESGWAKMQVETRSGAACGETVTFQALAPDIG